MNGTRRWLGYAVSLVLCTALTACATTTSSVDSSVVTRLKRADSAYEAGRLEEAESRYRELLADVPSALEARFRLGVIAYAHRDYQRAGECFRQVLERKADHSRAVYDLLMVHLQQARGLLSRFQALEPRTGATPVLSDLDRTLDALSREDASLEE